MGKDDNVTSANTDASETNACSPTHASHLVLLITLHSNIAAVTAHYYSNHTGTVVLPTGPSHRKINSDALKGLIYCPANSGYIHI